MCNKSYFGLERNLSEVRELVINIPEIRFWNKFHFKLSKKIIAQPRDRNNA